MFLDYIKLEEKIPNIIYIKLAIFIDNAGIIGQINDLRKKWFKEDWIQEYLYEQEDCDDLFFKLISEDNYDPKLETNFDIAELTVSKKTNKSIDLTKYEGLNIRKLSYYDRFLYDIELILHKFNKPSSYRIPLRHAILANKIFLDDYKVTEPIYIEDQNNLYPFSFGEMAINFTPEAKIEDIIEEFTKSKDILLSKYNQHYKPPMYFTSRKSFTNIKRDRARYWQHYGSQKLSYEKIANLEGGADAGVSDANVKESLLRYRKNLNLN